MDMDIIPQEPSDAEILFDVNLNGIEQPAQPTPQPQPKPHETPIMKKVDPKAAMAGLKALMSGVAGTPPPPPGASPFNAVGGSAAGAPPPTGDPFANL